MSLIKKYIYKCLPLLPISLLRFIEQHDSNSSRRGYIERIRLLKFAKKLDLPKLQNKPVCSIQKGLWDYPLFQVNFLCNMIGLCIYAASKGFRPQVDFVNNEGINLWEQFLEQPDGKANREYSEVCDVVSVPFSLPKFPTKEDVSLYNLVISKFFVLNDSTKEYFQEELSSLFPTNARICGVLCRGTDYTANKPKWHPIQPDINDVIQLVEKKMQEYACEYIYLATEEEQIFQRFEAHFPGKVLENKRMYFDSFYNLDKDPETARISMVRFDRERDSYYKSLEYLSSINLLSKCTLLIAGSAGGSQLALILNNNQYEYSHIFNCGLY